MIEEAPLLLDYKTVTLYKTNRIIITAVPAAHIYMW